MKSNEVFLRHVLDEITFLLEHTRALSFDDLMEDAVLQRACARSFEIMGEAVKNLSSDFRRKHKEIDWKNRNMCSISLITNSDKCFVR